MRFQGNSIKLKQSFFVNENTSRGMILSASLMVTEGDLKKLLLH